MWATISTSRIPNRSPAGNTNYGLVILVTMLNPSDKPILFDIYESFWIKIRDSEGNVIPGEGSGQPSILPAMRDVVRLNPGVAYGRAYNLRLRNGVMTFVDDTGEVIRYVLAKLGKYSIEANFQSDATHPFVADFENNNYQSLIKEFYRGPYKLGKFKIQVANLNNVGAEQ